MNINIAFDTNAKFPEKIIEEFRNKISISIYNKIIYSDTKNKLSALRDFIKS